MFMCYTSCMKTAKQRYEELKRQQDSGYRMDVTEYQDMKLFLYLSKMEDWVGYLEKRVDQLEETVNQLERWRLRTVHWDD